MKLVAGLAIASALAVSAAAPAVIHASATPHMIFASVGVVHGQTARLNISNISTPAGVDNPDALPPGPCDVVMGFVDGNNQMLLPAVRVAVAAGHSTQVELGVDNPDLRRLSAHVGGHSVQVRAVIGFSPRTDAACSSIVGSVEIVDGATGATGAVVNPLVYSGFNPQPDIPGFIGLGGQH
jgi:hypothetical protein